MIGTMFRLKREMLGNPVGAVGYVFNKYDDFDVDGEWGVQIIFPNGDYDGFSVEEQGLYLEMVGFCPRVSGYEFHNVMQVMRDHDKGFWFPEAKMWRR